MMLPADAMAVVVGIEEYQAGQEWRLDGPALDACRFARWLTGRGVPSDRISLLVSPLPENAAEVEQQSQGYRMGAADYETVRDVFARYLPDQTSSLLIFYWGGHGVIEREERRLICADAIITDKRNLNLSSLLNSMRSSTFDGHPQQLGLVDACQNLASELGWEGQMTSENFTVGRPEPGRDQKVLLAASPGERAINMDALKTGLFSQVLLEALDTLPTGAWPPNADTLRDLVLERFEQLRGDGRTDQVPSYLWFRSRSGEQTLFASDSRAGRAPAVRDLVDTASQRMRHEIAIRLNEEPGRDVFIESQARDVFGPFMHTDWRANCRNRIQQLSDFSAGERELSHLVGPLADIDWSVSYEVLWRTLKELPLETLSGRLAVLAARAAASDIRRREALDAAQQSTWWLIGQAEAPQFRSCLLIAGSWGSGKTRLLIEIAQAQCDAQQLAVFLDPKFTGSLRDELLARSGDLLGSRLGDLASLTRLLRDHLRKRLFVLFDDLGAAVARQPDVLDALKDLIAESTAADVIRWVVTIDARHLDYPLDGEHQRFWLRHGYHAGKRLPSGIGGWLDLDKINTGEQVGLQLLERRSDERNRADLAEIRRDAANFDLEARYLCHPLPAWLRIEVPDDDISPGLLNIYLDRFVSEYWERRKRTLVANIAQRGQLDHLVTVLARRLAAAPEPSVALADVQADTARWPRLTWEVVLRGIDALVSGGLLEEHSVLGTIEDLPKDELRPTLEIFWGYQIALALRHSLGAEETSAGILQVLRPWGLRARRDDWLAEAVTEFGLALMSWQDPKASITRSVWESWYQDTELPFHPLFLAGVSLPDAGQAQLRDWLKQRPPTITRKRELFLLMRLLAQAATSEWQGPDRLGALRRHYRLIGDSGLGTYFSYVVSVILGRDDLTTSQNYVATLSALAGSEDCEVAEQVAALAIDAGRRIVGDDSLALLSNVARFLQRSTIPDYARDFPTDRAARSRADITDTAADPNSAPAYFFWHHLVRVVCRSVTEDRGVDAFDDFARVNWFSGTLNGIEGNVALRMQQEANVALGAVFRRHTHHPRETNRFVQLVDALTQGRALDLPRRKQREIAYYIIRHTTITRRRRAVLVDESLRPTLRTLCHDPWVRTHVRTAVETCKLNGCYR
jgi:Caspase domain